ncbi:MAG: glycosyltransferase family 4 protein [Actinomycetota bacterium]
MRILILHSRYLSGPVSGENRVAEDEAGLLRDAGHVVSLWDPAPDETSTLQAAAATLWARGSVRRVRRLIAELRPDVVHCHNLYPMLSPAVLRVAGAGPALVMTLHNYRYACLPGTFFRDGHVCEDCLGRTPWPGVTHRCYRASLPGSAVLATSISLHKAIGSFGHVDLFLAVSEFLRGKHLQAGLPRDRVVVQTNFARPGAVRTGAGRYFLYAGRLAAEKGLAPVLRAWAGVREPLVVVGEGPEEGHLRAVAPPNVEFRGRVGGDEVVRLLADARALLVPSLWYEGTPRSIVEAYAAGVPVIASRVGSLPEVVEDGRTGMLVEVGDHDGWVRAVEALAEDPASERMGAEAFRAWERSHTPERALERLERSYELAVEIRDGGVPPA